MCSGPSKNVVFIFRVSYTNFEPSFRPPAFNFFSLRAEKGASYPLSVAMLQMTTNLAAYHSKYWLSLRFSGSGNWAWLSWWPLDKGLLGGCSLAVSQCGGLSKRDGRWKPTSRMTGIVVVRIQFSRVLHCGSQMLFECWLKASLCLRGAAYDMAEWHSITSATFCSLNASHKVQLSLQVRRLQKGVSTIGQGSWGWSERLPTPPVMIKKWFVSHATPIDTCEIRRCFFTNGQNLKDIFSVVSATIIFWGSLIYVNLV